MSPFGGVMACVLGLTAAVSVGCFGVFVATGIDLWLTRARRFRRWAFAVALLWFNVAVWGSVLSILINW